MSTRREQGMTATEAVLDILPAYAIGETIHYRDLANVLEFNETTVSGVLSELTRRGLVERVKGTRGAYARVDPTLVPVPVAQQKLTFDLVKVRADGSRIVTDEAGELYIVTLVVI